MKPFSSKALIPDSVNPSFANTFIYIFFRLIVKILESINSCCSKILSLTRISAVAFIYYAPISDFQVAKLEKITDIKSLINKGFLKILRTKKLCKV